MKALPPWPPWSFEPKTEDKFRHHCPVLLQPKWTVETWKGRNIKNKVSPHLRLPHCVLHYHHLFAIYLILIILRSVICFHRKHAVSFPLNLFASLICISNSSTARNKRSIIWLFVLMIQSHAVISDVWLLFGDEKKDNSVKQTQVTWHVPFRHFTQLLQRHLIYPRYYSSILSLFLSDPVFKRAFGMGSSLEL